MIILQKRQQGINHLPLPCALIELARVSRKKNPNMVLLASYRNSFHIRLTMKVRKRTREIKLLKQV